MARIRTIKPTIWQSEQLGRLSPIARLLFVGLISQADDDGRQRGAAALIKSLIFPYDDAMPVSEVDELLEVLAREGLIVRYRVADASYIVIPTFAEHQAINRKTDSTLPAPPPSAGGLTEASVSPHGALTEGSRQEGKGREEEEEGTTARAHTREAAAPRRGDADVAAIVAPLGRTLTPHQHARAARVLVEHGADVLAHLVAQARAPNIDRPVAAFVRFLAPESDALVEAVQTCNEQRERRAFIAADVARVRALKIANGIEV